MGDKGRAMWEVQIKYKNQEGDVRGSGGMQREGSRIVGVQVGCADRGRLCHHGQEDFKPLPQFSLWWFSLLVTGILWILALVN